MEKIFWKLLRENFRLKQVPYSLILSQYAFIPSRGKNSVMRTVRKHLDYYVYGDKGISQVSWIVRWKRLYLWMSCQKLTYPLIQPKLIEKYLQIEKQSYSQIQLSAKQTIEYIKNTIKPRMNLLEIRELSEEKLLELGADSFWY